MVELLDFINIFICNLSKQEVSAIMKRDKICIICPRGCSLCTEINDEQVTVSGNACPRGKDYAINECIHPVRTVTATVRVSNRDNAMVSVKTTAPIPKDKMMEVMKVLRDTRIKAPIHIGDAVLKNICGSDIVVTKTAY